ncbi:MAG: hypothetical protein U1A27_12655 [Phycisphaerae bacterium]
MRETVGSTSWPGRHVAALADLARLAGALPNPPTIVLVGPGAVTRLMRRWLSDARDRPSGLARRLAGDAARFADQALRRVPWLALWSFEPGEVAAAIGRPARWVVCDRSARVLAAAGRGLPGAALHRLDLSASPLPERGDVVVAFNVVSRTEDGAAAAEHLTAAVNGGGLLLVDDRSADAHLAGDARFERVGTKIWRRR